MWSRVGGVLLCAGLAVGCGGGGSGGPARFAVRAGSQAAQAAVAQAGAALTSADGTAFTLTRAEVNLREIRLELADGTRCEDVAEDVVAPARCVDGAGEADGGAADRSGSAELRLEGPFAVDLLTGASTPDLSQARVPAATYRRIEFRVDDSDASQRLPAGGPLQGVSFATSLGFTDQDGSARTLELALRFNEDQRIEPAGGISVSGEGSELLLMLDAQKWLAGIPVGSCLAQGDLRTDGDRVFLDEQSGGDCADVENVLKDNIRGSEALRSP